MFFEKFFHPFEYLIAHGGSPGEALVSQDEKKDNMAMDEFTVHVEKEHGYSVKEWIDARESSRQDSTHQTTGAT